MGQLEDYRLFLEVVDNQGISKAADKLGIVKSAVSRRLARLEDRLGSRLITRNARQWVLTEAGQVLYDRAQNLVTEADDISSEFRQEQQVNSGQITLSVPLHFGINVLAPALLDFTRMYPQIHLNVDFTDRFTDLVENRIDLAIRISRLKDSSLIARKLGKARHMICASPAYLNTAPKIEVPKDLQGHKILNFGRARRFKWTLISPKGKEDHIALTASMNSDNGAFLAMAARDGQGLVLAPEFILQPYLSDQSLVPVLTRYRLSSFGIYAVYPEVRHLHRRVRMLLDFLVDHALIRKLRA